MADGSVEKKVEVVLWLNTEETLWLKAKLQNAPTGTAKESEKDKKIRAEIWNALPERSEL